jgi:hypothetical protein
VLGRRVGVRAQPADDASSARRVDDRTRVLGHHHSSGVLRAEEHTLEQDRDRVVPGLGRHLGDPTDGADDAGVVEHHIQPSELGDGHVDRRRDVALDGHVAVHEPGGCAEFVDERSTGVVLQISDHDPGALRHEPPHGSGSDPAGSPGDDGHLPVESSGHLVPFVRDAAQPPTP